MTNTQGELVLDQVRALGERARQPDMGDPAHEHSRANATYTALAVNALEPLLEAAEKGKRYDALLEKVASLGKSWVESEELDEAFEAWHGANDRALVIVQKGLERRA